MDVLDTCCVSIVPLLSAQPIATFEQDISETVVENPEVKN
jgi:hypothetical protein